MVIIWLMVWSHTGTFGFLTQLHFVPQPVLLTPVKTKHMFQPDKLSGSASFTATQAHLCLLCNSFVPCCSLAFLHCGAMNSDEEHSYYPKRLSFVTVTSQVPRIYLYRQHHHKASKSAWNVLRFRNFFF